MANKKNVAQHKLKQMRVDCFKIKILERVKFIIDGQ